MRSGRFRHQWLMAICCVFSQQVASAQQFTAVAPDRDPAASSYFGIMGQVERPGVYTYPQEHLPLTTLVERAGGLTRFASGNLRIIRQGRGGQQTFYTPNSQYELQQGDLIVVDPRRRGSERFGTSQSLPEDVQRTNAPAGIQIGIVQLLSRPVVLSISPQEASLWTIAKNLNQIVPPQKMTILAAGKSPESLVAFQGNDVNLQSGTVLVMSPETIQYDRLPDLPRPIDGTQPHRPIEQDLPRRVMPHESVNSGPISAPAIRAGNAPTLVAPAIATAQTPVMTTGTPRFPTIPDEGVKFGNLRPSNGGEEDDSEEFHLPESTQEPVLAAPGAITVAAAPTDDHHETSAPEPSSPAAKPTTQLPAAPPPPESLASTAQKVIPDQKLPQPNQAYSTNGIQRNNEGAIAFVPREPRKNNSKQEGTGTFSTVFLLVSGGIAFFVIFAGVRWYDSGHAEPDAHQGIVKSDPLDAIIRNQLEIVEEPVPFPATMAFQAKPAPRRYLRLESAHLAEAEAHAAGASQAHPAPPHFANVPTVGRVSVEPVVFDEQSAKRSAAYPPLENVLPHPHFLNRSRARRQKQSEEETPAEVRLPTSVASKKLGEEVKLPVSPSLLDRVLANVKERAE